MIKYLSVIIASFLLYSCSEDIPDNPTPVDPTDPETPFVTMSEPEFVFGFLGENRYSYCPCVLEQEDGSVHMFFCGNPNNMIMVDNIYHVKINSDGTKTSPKSVLQPGISGAWDDQHTCDPSVVEGLFSWNGMSYKYALFFLGNAYGVYYNEIGVAFSNNLNADTWIKYPNQIVRKTWSGEGDQITPGGVKSWGVGQASVLSLDGKGKLLLTYTVGDISGTRIVWSEADFSDMNNYTISTPQVMLHSGLLAIDNIATDYTCNSDFAINKEADKIVMIRPVQPMSNDYPSYINTSLEIDYMNLSDFMDQSGSWTSMYRITPDDTNYPRNHNAALLRDNFGQIQGWEEPIFYYTVSKASPDVQPSGSSHAEWTYHIWKGQIIKENDSKFK